MLLNNKQGLYFSCIVNNFDLQEILITANQMQYNIAESTNDIPPLSWL